MSNNVQMLDSFTARLKASRKAAGLTQSGLAERLSVRQSAVSNWEQGISKPDISMLPALVLAMGTTLDALLGCADRPVVSNEDQDLLRRIHRLSDSNRRILNITLDGMLAVQDADLPVVELKDFKRVLELADHAAAGTGTPMTAGRYERTHTFVRMDSPASQADLIVTVNGQSMEPRYRHGDRLCVKKTDQLRYGEVGVFIVNNELYVKKYDPTGLLSLNPAFPHVMIQEDDQVRCVGKVTGVINEQDCADRQEKPILEELWSDRLRKH